VQTVELNESSDNIDVINKNLTNAIISTAECCIPVTRPGRKKIKHPPLPYWNENCSKAAYERNYARNKLRKKRTEENAVNYRSLKGQAQRIIKNAASELYWHSYCETLNRTSNLSAVWNMAKKMNGVVPQQK